MAERREILRSFLLILHKVQGLHFYMQKCYNLRQR